MAISFKALRELDLIKILNRISIWNLFKIKYKKIVEKDALKIR